jgi:hypothetical protein
LRTDRLKKPGFTGLFCCPLFAAVFVTVAGKTKKQAGEPAFQIVRIESSFLS